MIMNIKVCQNCVHKEVCYKLKNISDGKKTYEDYFGKEVVCPDLSNFNEVFMVETNFYDKVERHEDCTVEILTNSVTGEQSIGWYRNNIPPVFVEKAQE